MKKISSIIFIAVLLVGSLVCTEKAFAKTDLSIAETDITFSKDEPLDGDSIRIYTRVFNAGDNDVSGFVTFYANGKEISNPQAISIRPNTYDDVFADWKVKAGSYDVKAKISGLSAADDNASNNEAIKKGVFIDLDTDSDGIGDSKDTDTDGDGLTNEEEKSFGTNPLLTDTDGDKVNDKVDVFPLDKTEWRDTDADSIGDNKDTDIDGDGLTNEEETINYGANPLSPDSDNDGLGDKQEVEIGTNPNKTDTDGDGTPDLTDKFPLDASIAGASLADSLNRLLNDKNSPYVVFGIPAALLILFLLFRRKKNRR